MGESQHPGPDDWPAAPPADNLSAINVGGQPYRRVWCVVRGWGLAVVAETEPESFAAYLPAAVVEDRVVTDDDGDPGVPT